MYAAMAIIGFSMFGDETLSQITLNLPNGYKASYIAMFTTVSWLNGCVILSSALYPSSHCLIFHLQILNPFTKYPFIVCLFLMHQNSNLSASLLTFFSHVWLSQIHSWSWMLSMFYSLITLSPLNPLYTFALMLTPIANGLEELIPTEKLEKHGRRVVTIIVRTLLLLSTLLVATMVPFFGKFAHSSFLYALIYTRLWVPSPFLLCSFIWSSYRLYDVSSWICTKHACGNFHKYIKYHLLYLLASHIYWHGTSFSQTVIVPCTCFLSIYRQRTTKFEVCHISRH